MRVAADFFESIRTRVHVSDVVRRRVMLTKRGVEYTGLCPFHDEKSPSFTVNDIKRFYHCFGCGAHGDVIRFLSETSGLGYKEAAIKIAEDNGIEIPKLSQQEQQLYQEIDQIQNVLDLACDFFRKNLTGKPLEYLTTRSITGATIDDFSIGFAPSGGLLQKYLESKKIPLMMMSKAGLVNKGEDGKLYEIFRDRVIFPIRNIYGKVVGFGGRTIADAMPKYLNSPETLVFKKNETLYGEDKATGEAYKQGNVIVVEGYMDLIALHSAGFKNSVASLGTAVTSGHILKLWRFADEIIICLDGDAAGIRASRRVVDQVISEVSYNKKVSFVMLPSGYDPDDVIRKSGEKKFNQILGKRLSLSEMIWHLESMDCPISSNPESKAELEHKLQNYVEQVKNTSLKNNYAKFFKDSIWHYFSGRGGRKSHLVNIDMPTKMNERELLEYGILSLVVKIPSLLSDHSVQESLSLLDFSATTLSNFRDWILEKLNVSGDIDKEKLTAFVKNTRFNQLFMILSDPNAVFLDISKLTETCEPGAFWNLLMKRYHLLVTKAEYHSLASSLDDDSFAKLQVYQQEILKTQHEIEQLSESLIQSNEPKSRNQ